MLTATYALFWAGIAAQGTAAGAALGYLGGTDRIRLLRVAGGLALAAVLCLAGAFVLRFAQWGNLPLTSGADSLLLFVVMATVTAITVARQGRFQALLSFYLPPIALIGLLCAWMAVRDLAVAPKAMEVSQTLLFAHVGLAFQAYALFFIASLTSLAYVFQARRLKMRKTTGLSQKLPSLEDLDRTLYLLVLAGYPIFVVTLIMGLLWARFASETLSPTWWYSPKIALSAVMVLFYAASYHLRALGWLRGPKLAYFVFVGFGLLLAVYMLLELMQLTNYNFWGDAA